MKACKPVLPTYIIALAASLSFSLCHTLVVQLDIMNRNASISLELLCASPAENLNPSVNHTILWHGSEFGAEERERLAEKLQADELVPDMSVKSSKNQLCYLLAPKNSLYTQMLRKRRVLRDSSASIPSENGICPPGHRIDADRCFPCFPGSYTSGQHTECFLCPKDFYMDKSAADQCWPCPDGRKTVAQGADFEELCIYLDSSGHALITQNPPWVLIYCMIGVIIICVWIILIILLVRYRRELHGDAAGQVERAEDKTDSRRHKTLMSRFRKRDDKRLSDSDVSEEPIYAEIGDYDDIYEEPRRLSDPPVYIDLDAPEIPPKRRRSSIAAEERKVADSDPYEVPITKSLEDQYEVPIKKSSEDQYEVPIEKNRDENLYEIPKEIVSDHLYEVIDNNEEDKKDDVKSTSNEKSNKTVEEQGSKEHLSTTFSAGFAFNPLTRKSVKKK